MGILRKSVKRRIMEWGVGAYVTVVRKAGIFNGGGRKGGGGGAVMWRFTERLKPDIPFMSVVGGGRGMLSEKVASARALARC